MKQLVPELLQRSFSPVKMRFYHATKQWMLHLSVFPKAQLHRDPAAILIANGGCRLASFFSLNFLILSFFLLTPTLIIIMRESISLLKTFRCTFFLASLLSQSAPSLRTLNHTLLLSFFVLALKLFTWQNFNCIAIFGN